MYVTSLQRHNQAMLAPSRKDEQAVVHLIQGLKKYSELLRADSGRRTSAAVTQGMSEIARGLHKLIQQGPLGRLDRELIEAEIMPFIIEPTATGLSLVPDEVEAEAEIRTEVEHRRKHRGALPS